MWPFTKKGEVEKKIEMLDEAIKNSFYTVRQDMNIVNNWLNYFYNQELERQKAVDNLQSHIYHLASIQQRQPSPQMLPIDEDTKARLRKVEDKIDKVSSSVRVIEPVIDRVNFVTDKINSVEETQKDVFERLRDMSSKIEKIGHVKSRSNSTNLREKIVKKVAKHSKDYIKNLILSTIAKYNEISALQLREMIVEEQGLCSKSTFYRILEEIEQEDKVNMISRGKEKVYQSGITAKH